MPRPERRPPAQKARPRAGTLFCADGCGEYFASLQDLKYHRDGPHDARRCRTRPEMRDLGMKMDTRSRWHMPKPA